MIYLLLIALLFAVYMMWRTQKVYLARCEFIDYFYEIDPDGYHAGNRFREHVVSYDEMMFKFWVWPLSSFYPSFHAYKRGVK